MYLITKLMMGNSQSNSNVHGNAELKPEESVSILFHGGIAPIQVSTNVSEDLTCEKVLVMCLEHIQSLVCAQEAKPETHGLNKFLPTFGLLSLPEEKIWLPFNHVFKKSTDSHQKYKFRVRFRPPADKFSDGHGNIMTEYLFLQTLDDFLKGSLGKSDKLKKETAFALLHIALLFPSVLPMNSADKVNEVFKSRPLNIWNYTRYFSKTMVKRFISVPVIDHFWVFQTIKAEIHKYKIHDPAAHLGFYKQQFYQLLMKDVPEYCFEKYRVTEVLDKREETVTASISLYKESGKQEALFYGEQIQCSLESICSIKIEKFKDDTNKKWTVIIHVAEGSPKILSFSEEGAAESFVSMIEGYLRLWMCYNNVLCEELRTTSSKIRTELKSFAPIGKKFAADYLEESKVTTEPGSGAFLIHESLEKFGTYHVLARPRTNTRDNHNIPGSRNSGSSGVIECMDGMKLKLKMGEEELIFDHCCQVRSHLTNRIGSQVVPNSNSTMFPVLAEINDEFQVEKYYYGPHASSESAQKDSERLPAMDGDLHRVSEILDNDPLVRKFEVYVHDEKRMLLELRSQKKGYITAFGQGLGKLQQLYRIKKTSFLRYYSMVMDAKLSSALMEFPQHHDVLSYICKKPQSVAQKVNIMDQIINIFVVMEKANIYHGNLRLSKFYVFDIEGSDEIKVKLGDPGVVSYFDTLDLGDSSNLERVPWLSPKRRDNLKQQITYESEVYALGTTIYELVCQSDQFPKDLNLSTGENMLTYLNKNQHLPCPRLLVENDKEPSSEEDAGKKLVPEAVEVFTMIWEQMILMCWKDDEAYRPSVSSLQENMKAVMEKVHTFDADTVLDKVKELEYEWKQIFLTKHKDIKTDDNKNLTLSEIEKRLHNYLNKFNLPKDCLDISGFPNNRLGSGHFGEVYKGLMRPPKKLLETAGGKSKKLTEENSVSWTPVAVKKIKRLPKSDRRLVYKEIQVACELDHPNIVKLLYLSQDIWEKLYDPLMMVMEFMNLGDLSKYSKGYGELSTAERICHMLKILLDVAEGMVYLSGRDIVHRDLAARNVLLTDASGVVTGKISDFGLARIMEENYRFYKLNEKDELPFIWMPPECLPNDTPDTYSKFSSKGDAWSYGIVMWEAFSKGATPWEVLGNKITVGQLLDKYKKHGWRLPGDKIQSSEAYTIMKKCWEMEANKRPAFVELVQNLKHLMLKLQGCEKVEEHYSKGPATN